MDIYYKRVITFRKYPDNDLVNTDIIEYSKSKKRWMAFYTTAPLPDMKERAKQVGLHLKIKAKNITLVKL